MPDSGSDEVPAPHSTTFANALIVGIAAVNACLSEPLLNARTSVARFCGRINDGVGYVRKTGAVRASRLPTFELMDSLGNKLGWFFQAGIRMVFAAIELTADDQGLTRNSLVLMHYSMSRPG